MDQKPQMVLFAGPNGSGKTRLYQLKFAEKSLKNIEYVNPDLLAQKYGSEIRGGREAIKRRNELIASKTSFVSESTLSGNSALKLIDKANKAGFKTTLIYIGTSSPELNIKRVQLRVSQGGHDVPKKAIVRRYHDSMKNLVQAVQKSNVSHVFATAQGTNKRLFSAKNGVVRPREGVKLPSWVPERLQKKVMSRTVSKGRTR